MAFFPPFHGIQQRFKGRIAIAQALIGQLVIGVPADTSAAATPPAFGIFSNAGAPVNGTTGAGIAFPGSLLVDTAGLNLYINTGTQAAPTWKEFSHA